MFARLIHRTVVFCAGAAALLLSAVALAAPVSEQIIVDQFGWRAGAAKKVVIFADPITGQNSAVAYTPGASFQIRRVSDNVTVFGGSVTSWRAGATHSQSGDKVWYGDFSALTTPGDYYVYDPTNNLQSYNFKLDDAVYAPVLKASVRTYYYQRCGTAVTATNGGNWNHPICHEGANQDLAALQWLSGAATGVARDVHGGWHDAGDMNKYVPFTTNVLWDLMQAYEWAPAAFGDDWNIPESGNGVPDLLDEIKYELDWLLRMQTGNGSVCNRVAVTQYVSSSPPNMETINRYYTQPTSWATATACAHFAHAARLFANYSSQYPGYATTLQTAATNAWNWLNANPNMTPSSGNDGSGGMAAAGGDGNAGFDKRLRVLAAAELYKTTGTTAYLTYFDRWVKDPSTYDGSHNPLVNNWFDPCQSPEMNRACVVYATTTGATTALVDEIKTDLANSLSSYLGNYTNGDDAYRAYMYDGHYCWGSNQIKAQWGNLFVYGIKLNANPANTAAYREAAEEYLHYFHGRNPLGWCYLSNMGTKGSNAGADKPTMEYYHGWFADGNPLYDGPSSTYGPGPGYLVGGPNQYFSLSDMVPPAGEPPQKAYRDWNTAWNGTRNENSWEVTEPAIYYQAAYTLLASQFASAALPQVVAPSFSPAPGNYPTAQSVTITTTTSGATIRYTTNGTDPTSSVGTVYSGPVSINAVTTLKAVAYKSGMLDSPITAGIYTIGALPSVYIYDDAVAADWGDWSWSATNDPAATAQVKNGTKSFSTTFTGAYAAMSLRKGSTLSTAGYSGIKFWVHGGSTTRGLKFYSQTADEGGNSLNFPFQATAGTWTEITIPFSSLGNPTVIKRIDFQDTTGSAQSVIYLDDIRMYADVANQPPTDITLSSSTVRENRPSGTVIGTLGTVDADTGETFTYTLISGTGAGDNSSFQIVGNELRTAASFDFETRNSYSIRIRTTDSGAGNLTYEKVFAVSVLNVVEQAPVITGISSDTGTAGDGITADRTLVISGTAEAGVAIQVLRGGAAIGTTTSAANGAWSCDYTGTSLADGTYSFTATASDAFGGTSAPSAAYSVKVDGTAPALSSVTINGGQAQRSRVTGITVVFSEPVTLQSGAIAVKLHSGGDVANVTASATPQADGKTFVVSFTGTAVIGSSLPDGIYDLVVTANKVGDPAGNAVASNSTLTFHRLFGDNDGNKVVNASDYTAMRNTFDKHNTDPGFNAAFDYDGNNVINASDLTQFRQRFNVQYAY